jgi:hypothetical protein
MGDPHVHVGVNLNADTATRDLIASAFGLVGDLPSHVTTGCGLEIPRAMTSPLPNRVTCLPCREHAARFHLRSAEQVETISRMPGATLSLTDARLAADAHRGLARQFSGGVP